MSYNRELRTEAAHALTHNQEVWSDRGYAVVTAGGLSEGDTDFELDVGPYDVLVGDTDTVSVGPTTLSVNAPDSDPYWLVVYVDDTGLQTEQGPEGEVFVGDQSVVASNADVREITSPAPPTLADIGPVTVLGKVLVTSSGVTNSLIDDRVFQSERVFDVVNARSASAERRSIAEVLDRVGLSSAQSIPDNTFTTVGFDEYSENIFDEEIKELDGWDFDDNLFVAPEDGLYFFNVQLQWEDYDEGNEVLFRGIRDGSLSGGAWRRREDNFQGGGEAALTTNKAYRLNEGEAIEMEIRQRTGTTQDLGSGSPDHNNTFCEVLKIG